PEPLPRLCADLLNGQAQIGRVAQERRPSRWTQWTLGIMRTLSPAKLAPIALVASLLVIASGAVLYEATDRSTTVLAAELAADHVKCFAINELMGTREAPSAVESAMIAGCG